MADWAAKATGSTRTQAKKDADTAADTARDRQREAERQTAIAQAVNEFGVFGTSAAGSLLAGTIIPLYGWFTLVVVPLPLLAIAFAGLFIVRKDSLVVRSQAVSA